MVEQEAAALWGSFRARTSPHPMDRCLKRSSRNSPLDLKNVRQLHPIPPQLYRALIRQVHVITRQSRPADLLQPRDSGLTHQVRYTTGTVLIVAGATIVAGAVVLKAAP